MQKDTDPSLVLEGKRTSRANAETPAPLTVAKKRGLRILLPMVTPAAKSVAAAAREFRPSFGPEGGPRPLLHTSSPKDGGMMMESIIWDSAANLEDDEVERSSSDVQRTVDRLTKLELRMAAVQRERDQARQEVHQKIAQSAFMQAAEARLNAESEREKREAEAKERAEREKQEAEAQAQAERKRQEDEAERQRLADEAAEAERKRLADEAISPLNECSGKLKSQKKYN
jgi:hypothetical protein